MGLRKSNSFDDICGNCGGRRGLHNNMNQRCPMDIEASADHTEYRDSVFKLSEMTSSDPRVQILIDALRDIDLYDDVADPPFKPKQFGDIARKALREYTLLSPSQPGSLEGEATCVFCKMPCEPAPTNRGWSSVRYGKGLHFDCAGKVCDQGNIIAMKELDELGKDPTT